eukprot:jgi/Hompol1/2271/HPOL_005925-RA
MADGSERMTSSYNQPLFVGTHQTYARPTKVYCRLHELVALILHIRGGAEYYQDDSDDEYEYEYVDPIRCEEPIPLAEKINNWMAGNSNETLHATIKFNELV